jgi:hypothetical protein
MRRTPDDEDHGCANREQDQNERVLEVEAHYAD